MKSFRIQHILFVILLIVSITAAYVTHLYGATVIYNDAESHLNIAKRVVHSLTPGLAQFGAVWLPFQHILMLPFVMIEPLYRNGLAGAIVSMGAYLLMGVFFYKLLALNTKSKTAILLGCVVLLLNPNTLYFQSIPMNEIIFLAMAIGSVYFLMRWWQHMAVPDMIFASSLALLASMTRYEAWFLLGFESLAIILRLLIKEKSLRHIHKYEGLLFFHGFIAYSGVIAWFLWAWILIGDPLYFQRSEYSAQAQQEEFRGRGELLTDHNLYESARHFGGAIYQNMGEVVLWMAGVAAVLYIVSLFIKKYPFSRHVPLFLFSSSIAFSLYALYKGQTIIFVPGITPEEFGNNLFNIRYGLNAFPFIAYLIAMGFDMGHKYIKAVLIGVVIIVYALMIREGQIITYIDGVNGISSVTNSGAYEYMKEHYDYGLIAYDDFNRSLSVIKAGVPMQSVIYVGNKPYWPDTLQQPDKHARWIVISQNDTLYKELYAKKGKRRQLESQFENVYDDKVTRIYKLREKNPKK